MPDDTHDDRQGHNAEEFIIPTSDAHGHSLPLSFRTQPGHIRMVQNIIASRKFPYRSNGDLLRHALDRHLKLLEQLEEVPSTTAQVDAIIEIVRNDKFSHEMFDVIDRLGDQISTHVRRGDQEAAEWLVQRVQDKLDEMPDGYWKHRYKEKLQSEFGRYLKRKLNFGDGVAK